MNTETGTLYTTLDAIKKAKDRGEPLVEISPTAAKRIASAYRAEAREKTRRRKRDRMARASRKKNRA